MSTTTFSTQATSPLVRQIWPSLETLMNTWYPAQIGPDGLLVDNLGPFDYGYIPRTGSTVAYYNAGYVRALRLAAKLALDRGARTGDRVDCPDRADRIAFGPGSGMER